MEQEKKSKLVEYIEDTIDYIDVSQGLTDALQEVLENAEDDGIKLRHLTKAERVQVAIILKQAFYDIDDSVFYSVIDDAEENVLE